ncbi:cellulose biosynthesis cyclic di-GMP-binding regulatory protein BcsB [Paracoccus gahaiensis]|uniref:Cyclic di-GMP-binding protein n=1 Tax=Paracoccus gahaiensis TaxID=1706839 RepID=A0A4U0R449_9RHOB|nr:cellulose biosynthesis cyclic di-GMP-binding regulatory protein BcsB [Paracoccus gahaiensis]TJZ89589.1 cellulose biosynthesis cyclic di-GMP-binding regulatory protein BcsB [Paracoccus gahaiensis]
MSLHSPRPMLRWLACGALGLSVLAAAPVLAQDTAPPIISLPGASGATPLAPPSGIIPVGPGGGDSPMIQLQSAAGPPVGEAPGEPLVVAPVERDRTLEMEPQGQDWLLPLVAPTAILPQEVRIGESLPAPGILRLTGETASTRLRLDLPASVVTPSELRLALRSGVDVLTGSGLLQASVNGADPVEIPLPGASDFTTVSLPSTDLVAGANTIALSVRQPHRIFCGPEASFDVWTEIDLASSGAALTATALRPDAEGFAHAVRAQLARSGSLDLLVEPTVDSAVLREASGVMIASLAAVGRLAVNSFYGLQAPQYAAVALVASDRSGLSYRRGASGAIVLQVEYQGDALPDLTGALPMLDAVRPPTARIQPGQATPLSELGVADILGNTHYFRRDIPFSLPDDWLLLANQKARLTLRYGFSRSLAEGAILLVKVNEQTVRLLPLDRDGGEILPPLAVGFNASLLNPGRNILSFEMMVPGAPPDEACPIRTTDMLVVLAESTLQIPPSPSMTLPGLAAPFSGLTPARVTVPAELTSDVELQAQALRLASGLSEPLVPNPAVSLNVIRLGDLRLVPLDDAGVTQRQVQDLLLPARALGAGSAEPATPDQAPAPAATATEPAARGFRLDEGPEAAAQAAPGLLSRFGTWIGSAFTAQGRLWRDATEFRQTAFLGSQLSLPDWMDGRRGDALLWRPDPAQPEALWLILSPQVAVDSVADRLDRLIANRTAIGEAAVLRPDGTWDIWTPIRPPVLRERLAGADLRAILGNYASWSPLLFTLALLGLALLSALPALIYILATREWKDRP